MNNISRREHNKEERRKAILAAAREIVLEGGMDDLTMRKLAERAFVNVRTIYNLIGSQSDVLAAIVNEMLVASLAAFASVPDDAPIEKMEKMAIAPVQLVLRDPDLYKPALRVSERTPGLDSHALYEKDCIRLLKKELARGVRQGILMNSIPPERLAQHIYQSGVRAMNDWAYGVITDREFFRRVMDGLYLTLAAIAAGDDLRANLLARMSTR